MSTVALQPARIVAAYGRHYGARLANGQVVIAKPRGKKSDCAVGDAVQVMMTGPDEVVIEQINARRNLIMRSDAYKAKALAANVDALAFLVAPDPPVSQELLVRTITAARAVDVPVWLIENKSDLPAFAGLLQTLECHRPAIARTFQISAKQGLGLAPLREAISGYRVLLAGQSGMGKSRLLNALVPDAAAAIGELSVALSSGRHTTTAARLFALPPLENGDSGGEVIDTPGFQAFGLAHLSRTEIERGFPEFEAFTNACRYYDCRHVNEPGCGVRQGVVDGLIDATRHALYCRVANSP